jgi:hypothetical protein
MLVGVFILFSVSPIKEYDSRFDVHGGEGGDDLGCDAM